MKLSDDDWTAAEEGFWVLSVRGLNPLTSSGVNKFSIKILELTNARIGVVTN